MRLSKQLALAVVALALGACASLGPKDGGDRNAQFRLDRGLTALEAGRYAAAFDDLSWAYAQCADREVGLDALRALAALELDPRNPDARPAIGTELLARLVLGPVARAQRSLAETAFLTSLALGAPHPSDPGGPESESSEDPHWAAISLQPDPGSAHGCGAVLDPGPADPERELPRLPGPSMAALLTAAESARDSAVLRADSLGLLLTVVQEQLTATREELERIRRTLRP